MLGFTVQGQNLLPDENFLVVNRQLLYNPAYSLNYNQSFSASLRYSGYLGNKSILRKYYLEATAALLDTQRVQVALTIFHDEEGPYITFNNIKWGLSYKIIRTKRYYISAGMMFGAINMAFVGNGNVGGGSDWGIDTDMGVYLKSRRWEGGISLAHIPHSKVTPLLTPLYFDRTLNASIARKFNISPLWQNNWNITYRYGSYRMSRINIYTDMVYYGKYSFMMTLSDNKVLGIGGGLMAIDLEKILFDLNFSFNTNLLANSAIDEYRYEIGVCIRGVK